MISGSLNVEEKKKIILDFINGPLRTYLEGEASFGKFKELINERCGTNFTYSELYPSYLFNAQISYPAEEDSSGNRRYELSLTFLDQKMSECHAYGLCTSGDPQPLFACNICPKKTTKWYNCAKCEAGYEEQECTCGKDKV